MINKLDKLFLYQSKNWLKQNLAAKIITIFLFAIFILFILTIVYKFSDIYLYYFKTTGDYGREVSLYVLKVITLTVFILGVISSSLFFLKSIFENKNVAHWIISGIKIKEIALKNISRNLFSSTLILLLLLPIYLSFNKYFIFEKWFLLIILVELFWLSAISTYLGFFISIIWSKLIKIRINGFFILLSLVVFLSLFLNTVLPKETLKVYSSKNYDDFYLQLKSLPINNNFIISNWVINVIRKDNWQAIIFSQTLILFCVYFISKKISNKYLTIIWQTNNGRINKKIYFKNKYFPIFKNKYIQMLSVDILSFVRQKNIRNYLLFIFFMLGILGWTLLKINKLEQLNQEFDVAIKLIIYIAIILVSIVFSLRLLFPMAAKEKKMMWFNFSLPINRKKFVNQKLLTSIVVGIIFCFITAFFALNISNNTFEKIYFEISLFLNIISIFVIQVLCGFIQPNFMESENEEAISTNTTGFIALALSIITSIPFIIFLFQLYTYSYFSIWLLVSIVFLISITSTLYLIASKEVYRYNL